MFIGRNATTVTINRPTPFSKLSHHPVGICLAQRDLGDRYSGARKAVDHGAASPLSVTSGIVRPMTTVLPAMQFER